MTAPTIRTARADDYDRIVAVVDTWWGRPISHALPRLFLDHFHPTSLVAEDAGDAGDADATAGFLIGLLSPARADEAYIHFVGVRPDLRRSGLATELYERFFALARAAGRVRVRAITGPGNTGSIRFHTAMGCTVEGPVADLDGPGRDRLRFERSLAVGPGA